MDSEAIKTYFLEKLKTPGYDGLKGADLSLHIPVKAQMLNFALRTLISTEPGMKDFEEIVFSDLNDNRFWIKVNHKMLDKTIRCKIHEVGINSRQEQEVVVEFLDGVKFYEKVAINTFNTFKKGWSRFKKTFRGTGTKAIEGGRNFWKLSGSHVVINIDALLQKQSIAYLRPAFQVSDITTKENRLIFDIRIKT